MIRRINELVRRVVTRGDDTTNGDLSAENDEVLGGEILDDAELIEDSDNKDEVLVPIDPSVVAQLQSISKRYSTWIDDPSRAPAVRDRARAAMADAARRHIEAIGEHRPISGQSDRSNERS